MQYNQVDTYSQPVDVNRTSSLGLYISLAIFGVLAAFIGNYLIQNAFTGPQQSFASTLLQCDQGIYDNFNAGSDISFIVESYIKSI